MISTLAWVPRGKAAQTPKISQEKSADHLKNMSQLGENIDSLDLEKPSSSSSTTPQPSKSDDFLDSLNMDDYDNEESRRIIYFIHFL